MFKVGDRVRCAVDIYDVVEKSKVYTVRSVSGDKEWLYLEETKTNPWNAQRFELAFPPLPDYRDLASVVKPIPCYGVMINAGGTPIFKGDLVAVMNQKNQPPTTTKIIHNGKTTITMFSDDTKILTRPSEADADKFDPFIGWCVGVVEKMYGGKEKAKKFYKRHAVVQKSTRKVETVKEEEEIAKDNSAYHSCIGCKYEECRSKTEPCESCVADWIKTNGKTSIGWEPKEVYKC